VRSVFERVRERGAFDQTFGAQKFGRWLWILPKPQNLTPLHFSATACEKPRKRSLKCWIGKDWSLPRCARPRKTSPPQRQKGFSGQSPKNSAAVAAHMRLSAQNSPRPQGAKIQKE